MSQPALTIDTPPDTAPRQVTERAARSFVGHAKLIGALTLVSRVLGLAREAVATHYLGTSIAASAFTVAFVVPNLFRKLFGEGALSAAFIPLYSRSLQRDGAAEANAFAAAGVNVLCVTLLALTLAGEALLGAALYFAAGSFRPATLLTLKLTMIMLPYVLLICGTAFLGGVLQVHRRFGPPAIAPVILNVVHIAVVFGGAALLGLSGGHDTARDGALQTRLVFWLAAFVLVAGVLQIVSLLPALRAVGFRFRLVAGFWTPAIRQLLKLTVPVALGAGVLQVSVLLDKSISILLMQGVDEAGRVVTTHFTLFGQSIRYPLAAGAPMRLNVAQFLYQFPLGVFAIALATAIFPSLSAEAAADRDRFKSVLRRGIEATLFEGLPATLGLILVCSPAVRLIFQHGKLEPGDADLISRSVVFYSMAIWAFSLQQIINRAYYALHDTTTPLVMSLITLAVNLAVELPLLWTPLGEAGMAAGTAASFIVQSMVMLYLLNRRVGGLGLSELISPVARMLVATALMTAACLAVRYTPFYPTGEGRAIWLIQLLVTMSLGAGVYLTACAAMGLRVLQHLMPRRKAEREAVSPE